VSDDITYIENLGAAFGTWFAVCDQTLIFDEGGGTWETAFGKDALLGNDACAVADSFGHDLLVDWLAGGHVQPVNPTGGGEVDDVGAGDVATEKTHQLVLGEQGG